jgi:hypothetical protein
MDNGKQFFGNTLKALFSKYKVPDVQYTPKYTAQVNSVERYNKTALTAVSSFIEGDDHRSWDVNISKIQFAINSSTNEVTGFTPAFLVYARELVTCGSHYLNTDGASDMIFAPREEYAENLGTLRKIFDDIQASLIKAHARNSNYYNLRRKQADFNVGDYVWKRTYYLSDKDKSYSKKLASKFVKCRIIAKKSPLVYVLEDTHGNNIGDWHIKDIKLTNYRA